MFRKKQKQLTNKEINEILFTAYRMRFLESVEYLYSKQKEYKRSEFYKKTHIPLSVLYQNFFAYKKSGENLFTQFEDFFMEIDSELVTEKIEEILTKIQESEKIGEFFDGLVEQLDIEKLQKYSKELEGVIKNFKK